MDENNNQQETPKQEQPQQAAPAAEPKAENSDADQHKILAIVGYIIPLLFFIPLVTDAKNSKFAMFHANQQLVLLISAIVVNIVGTIIPFLGWFIILPIGTIVILVIAIMGIIHAAKGEMKPLPIIGGIQIIK